MTTCNAQGYPASLLILDQQLPSRYMPRAASASDVPPPLLPPPDRGTPPPPPPDGMPPPPPSEGGQTPPPPPPDGGGRRERSTARAEGSGPPPDQDSGGGGGRRRKGDVESLIMRWRRRPRPRGNRIDSGDEGFGHAPSAPDAPSYPTGVGLVSSTGGHPARWRWKNGGRDGRMSALAQQDAYHFPSTSEKSGPR